MSGKLSPSCNPNRLALSPDTIQHRSTYLNGRISRIHGVFILPLEEEAQGIRVCVYQDGADTLVVVYTIRSSIYFTTQDAVALYRYRYGRTLATGHILSDEKIFI